MNLKVSPLPVSRKWSEEGFTLIELVVVIIITGIMAVAAMPHFNLMSGYDETGYRDKIRSTIEYARRSAVAQRRVSCVNIAGNDVELTIETGVPEAAGGGTCATTQALNLPGADSKCGSGVINKVCHPDNVTVGNLSIHFDAQGRPLNAGGALLAADTTVTVTDSRTGETASLTIYAESGYVH